MRIMDTVMVGLARALDLREERQRVLTQNVANADTPGYKARELDFRDAIRQAFEARNGEAAGLAGTGPKEVPVVEDPRGVLREDGNTVDLDRAMAKLSANSMAYRTLSRMLAKKFSLIRLAIEAGRR